MKIISLSCLESDIFCSLWISGGPWICHLTSLCHPYHALLTLSHYFPAFLAAFPGLTPSAELSHLLIPLPGMVTSVPLVPMMPHLLDPCTGPIFWKASPANLGKVPSLPALSCWSTFGRIIPMTIDLISLFPHLFLCTSCFSSTF